MDLVKNKLELLDQKEKLLSDKMENSRKRKQNDVCNLELDVSNKKRSLPYDDVFDLEIEEKNTFLATAMVRIGIGKGEFVSVRALSLIHI